MKNKNRIWLFIAIIAIISFAAVSCDDGSGNGNGGSGTVKELTSPGLYKAAGEGKYTRISEVAANDVAAVFTRLAAANPSGGTYDGKYTLVIDQNVTLTARAPSMNRVNRELNIIGLGQERIITAPSGGAFYVGVSASSGAISLTLGENITIKGVDGMTAHLIGALFAGSTTSVSKP